MDPGVMVTTSTLFSDSFSSITCLRMRLTFKLCCAPSLPEPMALASYCTKVPLGSMWNNWGPFSYLESAISPETAQAMCRSTSTIFSIVVDSINGEVILFSTAKTTPSEVQIPMAVEPSLMASMAYSTWNSLPSGLKVFTPRSYSDRIYSSKGCRG
ncbi:hypothetical protein MSG28_012710 [Choristoneura fumiferana]|uniref:Uncharacterized protein n=1 Tax=Choristoneura fumiferana TaxID=7141 RepID=A0ACC0JHU0_CHOFU|nr:hypothetical protein MSG28_012710 [Choristoneura fumiferana]